MPPLKQGRSKQSSMLVSQCLPVYPGGQVHKKSSMRSVQAKLPLHGLESQLLISEAQNILEIKSQPISLLLSH